METEKIITDEAVMLNTADEIVEAGSKGCLKTLGIIGGMIALGAAGYFVFKKLKNKKESADTSVVVEDDVEFPDEDIESED